MTEAFVRGLPTAAGHETTSACGVGDVDRGRAATAVTELLSALGLDPNRDGLVGTPARVARMFDELLTPTPFEVSTFTNGAL